MMMTKLMVMASIDDNDDDDADGVGDPFINWIMTLDPRLLITKGVYGSKQMELREVGAVFAVVARVVLAAVLVGVVLVETTMFVTDTS